MRALAEAGRALIYHTTGALDRSRRHPDPEEQARAQARVDLLTPVVKGWCTDAGVEAASIGVQIHGGMGYIEETGAAQHFRDARAAPIYEGTNGIQAADLAFRKVGRDGGSAARTLIAEMQALDAALRAAPSGDLTAIGRRLAEGISVFARATDWVADACRSDPHAVAAGAGHYLRLAGLVVGGYLLAEQAIAASRVLGGNGSAHGPRHKIAVTRFFCDQLLPQATALLGTLTDGHDTVTTLPDEAL